MLSLSHAEPTDGPGIGSETLLGRRKSPRKSRNMAQTALMPMSTTKMRRKIWGVTISS